MSSPARTMVLTMDAADPDLVRTWAADGKLPNVARMLASGTSAPVSAAPGTFVTSNWASVTTALGPDHHRYLCWDEIDPTTYVGRETNASPETILGKPLWQHLDEAGQRIAFIDIPHTWPDPINGVMVVEWGCHDRHHGTRAWPPETIGEIDCVSGGHPIGQTHNPNRDQFAPCDYRHRAGAFRTPEEEVELFGELQEMVERKRAASLHLLDRGDWDVFWTVFGETHCTGHQFFHVHDSDHPRHDPAVRARLGVDPILDIYQRVDAAIGDHLDRLGSDDSAYLFLPHGMIAHHDGTHLLDPVLVNLERSLDEPEQFGRSTRLAALGTGLFPPAVRRRASRAAAPLVRRRLDAAPATTSSDAPPMAERRWYFAPNNTVTGGIRLNLAGREGSGRIHPGARNEVISWLTDRLLELVNVDTGEPVVTEVTVADDIYQRRADDLMPDLFVQWNRAHPIERIWSPATGTIVRPYDHWRTGDHYPEGLLVASGPGIAHGQTIDAIDSIDVAVTVSRSVGVTMAGVQGRPIAALITELVGTIGPVPPARWTPSHASSPALRTSLNRLERSAAVAKANRLDHWDAHTFGLERIEEALVDLATAHHDTRQEVERLRVQNDELRAHVVDLGREAAITRTMTWLAHRAPTEDTLITAIIPTRNRASVLGGAIDSILAQTHERLQLIVVNDGSTDGTADLLARYDDPRICLLDSTGNGVAAARNTGIEQAAGNILCYLDDDNRFHPDWFKALAWSFAEHPEQSCGYGARLVDDFGRHHGGASNGEVWSQFLPWDRAAIADFNRTDMNVVAHRPGPIRFDPELSFYADWDLVLALTADSEPFEISAIAAFYTTTEATRLTTHTDACAQQAEYDRIRDKHGRSTS